MKYTGIVDNFFETGTEGMMWVLIRENMRGYEAIVDIQEGDELKVFHANGSVLFDGVINPDYKAGYMPYPLNPEYGQPCALGYWIHWTQKDWKPDDWAALFIGQTTPLRAELIRKEQNL